MAQVQLLLVLVETPGHDRGREEWGAVRCIEDVRGEEECCKAERGVGGPDELEGDIFRDGNAVSG